MNEHPILFSTEMVKAILEGRKTQTRRVIKHGKYFITQCKSYKRHPGGGWWGTDGVLDAPGCDIGFTCPYGEPGDRLWVREPWCDLRKYINETYPNQTPFSYKADDIVLVGEKWKPSIHMPRNASRITLEVVNIRVERVQDISQQDAKAEGAEPWFLLADGMKRIPGGTEYSIEHCPEDKRDYRMGFQYLWDSINAKRGYDWDSNPWVWVVEFKRI